MDAFSVINPGPMTTVQDLGRLSFLDRGVPLSGALDSFSCRIANILAGNTEDAAVLEITVMGPTLEVLYEADIALTGAEMGMTINGKSAAGWISHRVKPGDMIRIPRAINGCRAYLAVTGGIDVPPMMGSRATFVRAGIGGVEGRSLKKGDLLKRGEGAPLKKPRKLPDDLIPHYPREISLRTIPGPQNEAFSGSIETFFSSTYEVTTQADRMGYRLKGPPLQHDSGIPKSIITEPTVPGNIQVPEDGLPIILLVEQTTGGYTKIATVISTDISRLAQALPGHKIAFEKVDLETAHDLYRKREILFHRIMGAFEDRLVFFDR